MARCASRPLLVLVPATRPLRARLPFALRSLRCLLGFHADTRIRLRRDPQGRILAPIDWECVRCGQVVATTEAV